MNDFEVHIEGKCTHSFSRNNYSYVSVPHKGTYKIQLINNSSRRTDTYIKVNGIDVGSWLLPAYDSITIERPSNIAQKFTFVAEDSLVAGQNGVWTGVEQNGLVEVKFVPERKDKNRALSDRALSDRALRGKGPYDTRIIDPKRGYNSNAAPMSTYTMSSTPSSSVKSAFTPVMQNNNRSGATILGKDSNQEFDNANKLYDCEIDWNRITIIRLRLVLGSREDCIPPRLKY